MALATELVLASGLALALAACSASGQSAGLSGSTGTLSTASAQATPTPVESAAPTEAPGHVGVIVTDMAIRLTASAAAAGEVTFDVKNVPSEPPYGTVHELVVIRTDLDAADLPVEKNEIGLVIGVIEDGLDIVGRTAHLPVSGSESLTLNLTAGHYVVICNLTGHYMYMRQNFDVH